VHFYEIDPAVIDIAADPRYFTYISDALALPGVVIGRQEGDGRLGLAAAPDSSYDLIVIDAFSSDAIPIHLMTLEAIAMYRERLKPGGVIAFHISSRYFDLQPVLTRAASALEMTPILRDDNAMTKQLFSEVKRESMWLAMARKPEDLGSLMRNTNWQRLSPNPLAPLWTDDYSNPLRVFVGW
jgi:spermidine synthase